MSCFHPDKGGSRWTTKPTDPIRILNAKSEPEFGGAVRAAGPVATGACGAGGVGLAIHPAKVLAEGAGVG